MRLVYSLFIFSSLCLTACTGTQNTSSSGEEETVELSDKEQRDEMVLAAGYSKCEVVDMGTQDECGFVLQDLNAKLLYKPLTWDEEFSSYKADGNIVYIKFRPSKATQTVCLQSMPIVIDEMKLVE